MAVLLEIERVSPTVESQDSPLGRWTGACWTPGLSSRLRGLVERIWYFDGTMAYRKERVFPDGRAELIVMLDDPHRDGDTDALHAFPAVCINGLRTRPSVVVAPRGRCRVLGIRLEPLGACALLRAPIRELTDVTIDLRDALGRASDELGDRCANSAGTSHWNAAGNAASVVRAAAQWAMSCMNSGRIVDPTVHLAVDAICGAQGVASVDEIAAAASLSRAQFAQRFRHAMGVTPKRFARIVRFSHALRTLGQSASIAFAAAELSYHDQAHMYRDFAEFAGMTPGAFLSARRYPGSASLAE